MALAALRERIGHAAFDRLLQAWVSLHRHGHGSIPGFEALADEVSGQDLTTFFDAWLEQPTKPAATADNGV